MYSLRRLRESLLGMESGNSPGSGGLGGEYLTVLGEMMNEEHMDVLGEFGIRYLWGTLPVWFYSVVLVGVKKQLMNL